MDSCATTESQFYHTSVFSGIHSHDELFGSVPSNLSAIAGSHLTGMSQDTTPHHPADNGPPDIDGRVFEDILQLDAFDNGADEQLIEASSADSRASSSESLTQSTMARNNSMSLNTHYFASVEQSSARSMDSTINSETQPLSLQKRMELINLLSQNCDTMSFVGAVVEAVGMESLQQFIAQRSTAAEKTKQKPHINHGSVIRRETATETETDAASVTSSVLASLASEHQQESVNATATSIGKLREQVNPVRSSGLKSRGPPGITASAGFTVVQKRTAKRAAAPVYPATLDGPKSFVSQLHSCYGLIVRVISIEHSQQRNTSVVAGDVIFPPNLLLHHFTVDLYDSFSEEDQNDLLERFDHPDKSMVATKGIRDSTNSCFYFIAAPKGQWIENRRPRGPPKVFRISPWLDTAQVISESTPATLNFQHKAGATVLNQADLERENLLAYEGCLQRLQGMWRPEAGRIGTIVKGTTQNGNQQSLLCISDKETGEQVMVARHTFMQIRDRGVPLPVGSKVLYVPMYDMNLNKLVAVDITSA